jgi:uncharacterized membrane protein
MSLRLELLPWLIALTAASFACRAAGFWLMGFLQPNPRLQAALRAAPLAVMVGIVTPAAARGRPAELVALLVIAVVMRLTRSDLVASLAGVAVVAALRQLMENQIGV